MEQPVFYQAKFDELVLYIALRSADDPRYGATKLNKILFYSDFCFFAKHGKSITGAEYQKLPHGPAPRQMKPAESRLLQSGDAALTLHAVGAHTQKRLQACRQPNLALFTADEISTVDEVMQQLLHKTAAGVSAISHQFTGWKLAHLQETIPYFTVRLPPKSVPLSAEEMAYGRAVADRIDAECARS